MHKAALLLVGGGTMAVALSLVMGWVGFPHMIKHQIRKAAKLEEGTELYDMWSESKVPIYLKFRFFNVTNADEVEQGGRPNVVEIGPYTYLEIKVKLDIEPGEGNGTLRYRQKNWLYFVPKMSLGKEDDLLTFINVPFVAAARMVTSLSPEPKVHETINTKLGEVGEKLFKTAQVQQLLFDGLSVAPYLQLLKSFGSSVKIPAAFKSGKFALYNGKNGSDEGLFEVQSGWPQWKDIGQIRSWNNMTTLPWWKSDECNRIKGTDGTIFAPLLTKQSELQAFSRELCRSIVTTYEENVEFKGFPLYRFSTSEATSQGANTNPKNACFCLEEKRKELCDRDGLLMMGGCSEGAPISFSSPHFYGGSANLATAIGGLDPNKEKHKTHLDIEPWTAVIFRAAKRLQMNIDLEQYESMETFAKVRNVAFPIMWVEESAEITDDLLTTFIQLYTLLGVIDVAKYVLMAISAGFLVLGLLIGMCKTEKVELLVVK